MIRGDYSRTVELPYKGKKRPFKVVRSVSGEEYGIGKQMGKGGFATTYLAVRLADKKELVFKEFVPNEKMARIQREIRKNLEDLAARPVLEEDGKAKLHTLVQPIGPDGFVDLPASKGFGYLMEKVDTERFLKMGRFRAGFPDADVICSACINIASTFRRIHISKGMCYKDINDDNYFIDPKTGDVRIIDCDNLGLQKKKTVDGTRGYMAPEVYETHTPDFHTDYFSLAVTFYRILVGGYPYDGKKAVAYMEKNNVSVEEAQGIIYGREALFAFDPKDRSNTIEGLTDPIAPNLYKAQLMLWNDLPKEIRDKFVEAFSTGKDEANRHLRPTDRDWIMTFQDIKKRKLVKCPGCGRISFGSEKPGKKCMKCGGGLPVIKPVSAGPGGPKTGPQTSLKILPQTDPKTGPQAALTTIRVAVRRDIVPTFRQMSIHRDSVPSLSALYPGLPDVPVLELKYNPKLHALAAFNCTSYSWIVVSSSGAQTQCPPGSYVVLTKGCRIAVIRRKLQFDILDIL